MLRIASGTTDQYAYFNAGEVGLSSFTVYRSRNGAAAAAMTTPTINETDSSNMPGVYELLLDEDMTIGAGNVTEHMVFWVSHAGITPILIDVELFNPAAIGALSDIAAIKAVTDNLPDSGALSTIDANVDAILVDTGTTLPGTLSTIDTVVDAILADTGTTLDAKLDVIDAIVDAIKAKTDSLTFSQAGHVDANVRRVNNVTITGDGDADPFDVT